MGLKQELLAVSLPSEIDNALAFGIWLYNAEIHEIGTQQTHDSIMV